MSNALRGGVEKPLPPRLDSCNTYRVTENSPSFKLSLPILAYFRIFYTILLIFGNASCLAEPFNLSEIDTHFVLSGKVAHDEEISSITKFGNTGILVSDEDSDVQILSFDNSNATITENTPLLSGSKEADLEATAVSPDGWFYATGSHGVTKRLANRAPSREHVFRFKLSSDNQIIEKSVTSLTPHLLKIPELRSAFGKPLQADGLNIEGLTAIKDTLYFGFRRPHLNREVLILEISSSTLFNGTPESPKLHRIPAHPANGIRALETLSDGHLLILLSGKKSSTFVTLWKPGSPNATTTPIPVSKSKTGGKAESIILLDENSTEFTFAILYDSVAGGGARTFRLRGSR